MACHSDLVAIIIGFLYFLTVTSARNNSTNESVTLTSASPINRQVGTLLVSNCRLYWKYIDFYILNHVIL